MENRTKRILIVDDNEINIKVLFKILTKAGYVPEVASDGKEALLKFSKRSIGYYSLIITDIRMPGISGIEEAAGIRTIEKDRAQSIPILAYTASLNDEELQAAKRAGINECILKPLTPNELLDKVERWI